MGRCDDSHPDSIRWKSQTFCTFECGIQWTVKYDPKQKPQASRYLNAERAWLAKPRWKRFLLCFFTEALFYRDDRVYRLEAM